MSSPRSPARWVLVVEDNPEDERLASRVFAAGHRPEEYHVARDGVQALQLLKRQDTPALVLLDLKLPRLSGVEVLMAIRDDPRLRTVPVVVLTSSDEITDRNACYELGCNAFVRKPLDYDDYRKELNLTLDFWLTVNLTA